jgi:hypothetical protein
MNEEKIRPNQENTPEFCLEVLRKVAENFSQYLNQAPSEYEGRALLPDHLVQFTLPASPLLNDVAVMCYELKVRSVFRLDD